MNSSRCNPFPRVLEIAGKLGVDYAVEAAGKVKIMGTAFRSVRDLVRVVHMIITFALTPLFVHYLLRHKDFKLLRVFSGDRNKEDLG